MRQAAPFLHPCLFIFSLRKYRTCEHDRLRALEIKSPESLLRAVDRTHIEIHPRTRLSKKQARGKAGRRWGDVMRSAAVGTEGTVG